MPLFFTILGLGFALGMRHAIDADHVVAVTTIVNKQKKIHHGALIGILWGIGHAVTVTLVALPIIFFSLVIPPKIGLGFELAVGAMLVILGILNLTGISTRITTRYLPSIHKHSHFGENKKHHEHIHVHFFDSINNVVHHLGFFQISRPLLVGLVHGLAGSSAIALLILSTIKDPKFAGLYLFVFHFGVIFGMMLITTFLGVSVALIKKRSDSLHKNLVFASGLLSFVFGLYIMYQTGSTLLD